MLIMCKKMNNYMWLGFIDKLDQTPIKLQAVKR